MAGKVTKLLVQGISKWKSLAMTLSFRSSQVKWIEVHGDGYSGSLDTSSPVCFSENSLKSSQWRHFVWFSEHIRQILLRNECHTACSTRCSHPSGNIRDGRNLPVRPIRADCFGWGPRASTTARVKVRRCSTRWGIWLGCGSVLLSN